MSNEKFNEGDKVTLTCEGLFVASCQISKDAREAIDRNTIYQVSHHFSDGRLSLELFIDIKGVFKSERCYVLDSQAIKHITINVEVDGPSQQTEKKKKFNSQWYIKVL